MNTVIEPPVGRKAQQLVDARGRHQLTTCEHHGCRCQPRLHLEDVREEEMEEGRCVGLTNLPSGHKADGERTEREDHHRKRQPSRIHTAEILRTEFLAHASPPRQCDLATGYLAGSRRHQSTLSSISSAGSTATPLRIKLTATFSSPLAFGSS